MSTLGMSRAVPTSNARSTRTSSIWNMSWRTSPRGSSSTVATRAVGTRRSHDGLRERVALANLIVGGEVDPPRQRVLTESFDQPLRVREDVVDAAAARFRCVLLTRRAHRGGDQAGSDARRILVGRRRAPVVDGVV